MVETSGVASRQSERAARTSAGVQPLNRDFLSDKSWSRKNVGIVREEIAAINTRRPPDRQIDAAAIQPDTLIDVVGLSLSGGGIRSAAVSLGVLQALNHNDRLKHIDYLSTVSGGGYLGSSLSATMTKAGNFVFGGPPDIGSAAPAAEISDTPAVGHLRNYANYLVPSGARDLLTSIAIIVRGLVANLSLTVPVVLFLAAMTILSNPTRSSLNMPNVFGVHLNAEGLVLKWFTSNVLVNAIGFTLIGAAIGLVLVIGREVANFFSHHEVGSNRRVVLFYIVGITVTVGVICDVARHLDVENFSMTISAWLLGLAGFFVWALVRSFVSAGKLQEFRGHGPTIGATYLVLTATIAFFEVQPFIIAAMFRAADGLPDPTGGAVAATVVAGWIKSLAVITTPIAAVVTMFRQQFTGFAKSGGTSQSLTTRLLAFAAKGALWIAGLALPLLIWVCYLYLSDWGIVNDRCGPECPGDKAAVASPSPNAVVSPSHNQVTGKLQFDTSAKSFSVEVTAKPSDKLETSGITDHSGRLTTHVPKWLLSLADRVRSLAPADLIAWIKERFGAKPFWSMLGLYWFGIIGLFFLSWWLKPNANSLHRLYRDRLSKAFLFDPGHYATVDGKRTAADGQVKHLRVAAEEAAKQQIAKFEPSMDQGRDFLPLDDIKLSALFAGTAPNRTLHAPYHIINAALNIQGSDYANRRGRNADFFMFSPLHIGSDATGYTETERMETCAPALDLATAMAISGAAASSNMGAASIRPLTPTLALLNVRLGYWLKNPRYATCEHDSPRFKHLLTLPKRGSTTPFYLWSEITGRLYENSDAVYLTDGGHIENLGVYELLRRRCKVIIAVDAETDPEINCTSLIALERYARIDLGIRIDLPWTAIRTTTRAWMDLNAGKEFEPADMPKAGAGPHVAIGVIDYGGGQTGHLVYVKASLNGDENDYIRDHARRNDRFPQESTGDQFFTEEQFEVYRALGFHMVQGWLQGSDDVAVNRQGKPDERCRLLKFDTPDIKDFDEVRKALGMVQIKADAASSSTSGA